MASGVRHAPLGSAFKWDYFWIAVICFEMSQWKHFIFRRNLVGVFLALGWTSWSCKVFSRPAESWPDPPLNQLSIVEVIKIKPNQSQSFNPGRQCEKNLLKSFLLGFITNKHRMRKIHFESLQMKITHLAVNWPRSRVQVNTLTLHNDDYLSTLIRSDSH